MRKILILISMILVIISTGCGADHYKNTKINAIVVDKDYHPSTTERTSSGIGKNKKYSTHYISAKHELDIKYKDIEVELNVDEDTYDKYDVNDEYPAILSIGYDENNKEVSRNLEER